VASNIEKKEAVLSYTVFSTVMSRVCYQSQH